MDNPSGSLMFFSMQTVTTIYELRSALLAWRVANESVGLVPNMGALHRGHMALIAASRKTVQRTVASIFVNPTQFAPTEDLAKYPRQLEADQKLLTENGCDLLFAPTASEMYPEGFASRIEPGPVAAPLEGAFRPTHFSGVATVVAKLLLQVMPDIAFFGEKDYQQLQVIRRTARDLDIPAQIAGVPTVRDADGLALSSRNAYLSADERRRAVVLPQALQKAKADLLAGTDAETALQSARAMMTGAGFAIDYVELAHAATLQPQRDLSAPCRLLTAARMGTTRLIDNLAVNH